MTRRTLTRALRRFVTRNATRRLMRGTICPICKEVHR